MNEVYVWIIAICTVFLISGILLFLRSNTAVISSRSQLLLNAFHMGNWIESVFLLLIIYSDDLNLTSDGDKKFWIINSIVGVSHFVVYFPYILRAYRLNLIFCLEENIEDYTYSNHYERTTQKWLIKALFVLISPITFTYLLLAILVYTNTIGTVYNPDADTVGSSPYVISIIFLRFLEHSGLICANYFTRHIIDDFKMNYELSCVTIVYFLTPSLSLFVHVNKQLYWVYIIRNLLLLSISVICPIILSFTQQQHYQLLTVDMLTSLELILLHPTGVDLFQKFVKDCKELSIQTYNNQGEICLDLLLSIECWIESKDESLKEKIKKKIKYCGFETGEIDEDCIFRSKLCAFNMLQENYFGRFIASNYMKVLRKMAYRHDLYQIKINYSSLRISGQKLNFVNHDWPLESN